MVAMLSGTAMIERDVVSIIWVFLWLKEQTGVGHPVLRSKYCLRGSIVPCGLLKDSSLAWLYHAGLRRIPLILYFSSC